MAARQSQAVSETRPGDAGTQADLSSPTARIEAAVSKAAGHPNGAMGTQAKGHAQGPSLTDAVDGLTTALRSRGVAGLTVLPAFLRDLVSAHRVLVVRQGGSSDELTSDRVTPDTIADEIFEVGAGEAENLDTLLAGLSGDARVQVVRAAAPSGPQVKTGEAIVAFRLCSAVDDRPVDAPSDALAGGPSSDVTNVRTEAVVLTWLPKLNAFGTANMIERLTLVAGACEAALRAQPTPHDNIDDTLLADLSRATSHVQQHNLLLKYLEKSTGAAMAFAPVVGAGLWTRGLRLGRVRTSLGDASGPVSTTEVRLRSLMRAALDDPSRPTQRVCGNDGVNEGHDGTSGVWQAMAINAVGGGDSIGVIAICVDGHDADWVQETLASARKTAMRALTVGPTPHPIMQRAVAKARSRPVVLTACTLAALIAALVFVPVPNRVVSSAALATLDAREVTAPFDGTLAEVLVSADDTVVAGETVLARIATRDLDLQVASNVAALQRAVTDADLARRESRPADLRIAELTQDKLRAELAILRHRIEQTAIKAPIDGVVAVIEVEGRTGSSVVRGESLFRLSKPQAETVDIRVADNRIPDVARGQTGYFRPLGQPFLHVPFTVTRIHPIAQTAEGQVFFRVIGQIDAGATNSNNEFRPGAEGEVAINARDTTLGRYLFRDIIDYLARQFWI